MSQEPLPQLRQELGFGRTVCACDFCRAPCRHIPGGLVPDDLTRLCPAGHDLWRWAEQHLRALVGLPAPTLVPARQAGGVCHWHIDGKCAVHNMAPFGCAFFDAHMSEAQVQRRSAAAIQARQEDAAAGGLYSQVWRYLCRRGLVDQLPDREALADDVRKIGQKANRQLRQLADREVREE